MCVRYLKREIAAFVQAVLAILAPDGAKLEKRVDLNSLRLTEQMLFYGGKQSFQAFRKYST